MPIVFETGDKYFPSLVWVWSYIFYDEMYEKLLQAISIQNLACQEIDGKVIMNIE